MQPSHLMPIKLVVRWVDGYLESFDCEEVRFGGDIIWARLSDGGNRHIPVTKVRWWSLTPESHEKTLP